MILTALDTTISPARSLFLLSFFRVFRSTVGSEKSRQEGYAPINSKLQHPPPRAYPGHLTVHRALGGGNLNVSLEGWGI